MILVVGGTGFIGRNLLVRLHASGRATMTASRNPDRVFLATHAPSIGAVTMDALYDSPETVLSRCSAVIWLGGGSGPVQNSDCPWAEMRDTVEPVLRMAHLVVRHCPDAIFLFLSSGGTVYGNPVSNPVSEVSALRPISAYGFGKVMGEQALALMADTVGLRLSVLRPANPVGRWQVGDKQGLVAVMLNAVARGQPVRRFGGGSAVRDYFDVGDLCDAILAIINHPDISVGSTYNVGSGVGYSVNEILSLVSAVLGRPALVEDHPARANDVRSIVLDCSRIRNALGWQTRTPLEKTISMMVASRQSELSVRQTE